MTTVLKAKDGLRARDSGSWGRTKLEFLDYYCPAAIQATERKLHRYYVDLFAGPGVNVVRGTAAVEYEGSPIKALRYHGQQRPDLGFTNAVFVNAKHADYEALEKRVDKAFAAGGCLIPRGGVSQLNEDANNAVAGIMRKIPPEAYVLVFADMEAPDQWPWASMKALKEHGHKSVEVYTLFPLDMAIVRLMPYKKDDATLYARTLNEYFGTDEWVSLAKRRLTGAQTPQLRRELVELYLRQLRTLWKHAGEIADVHLRGDQGLYKMLFASDHNVGKGIADWIKSNRIAAGQGDLFG